LANALNITEAEILNWIAAFIWPLLRISALFVAMPLFSIRAVPATVRVILTLAMTLFIMPLLPPMTTVDLFSATGFSIAIQQIAIGLTIGFILQMVFGAVVFAGQGVALGMGLGFASMVDPQNGQQVPVVAQFYVITMTLVFLSLDGHLLVIKMLLDSFTTLPINLDGIDREDLWLIAAWGSRVFASGLLLSMPIIVSLLLVNICLGVAARAAPQLNIFSVGFPATLLLGILLIWLTLPAMLEQFSGTLTDAYDFIEKLLHL
jgi:flagellar biosynthetic protein FliR